MCNQIKLRNNYTFKRCISRITKLKSLSVKESTWLCLTQMYWSIEPSLNSVM